MRHKLAARNTPKDTTTAGKRLVEKALSYSGFLTRVARRLDVDLSHVRRVAIRERRSPQVWDALVREASRIESEHAV